MTRISNHHLLGASRRLPPRITLLASNSKYKFKEERKRILKLSVKKLRSIEDPEAFLSRSVLINNTLKRLQSEVREEKAKKTNSDPAMPTYTPSPYSFYSIEKAYREEMEHSSGLDNNGNDSNGSNGAVITSSFPSQGRSTYDQHMFDADDEEEDDEDNASQSSNSTTTSDSSDSSEDENEATNANIKDTISNKPSTQVVTSTSSVEDDLLAEVYMPTPSMPPMIASIDPEDDLHLRRSLAERPSTPVPWTISGPSSNPSAEAVMKESCDNEDIWSEEAVRTECWTKTTVDTNPQTCSTAALRPSTVNTNTWPSVDWPTYTPNSPTSSTSAAAATLLASSTMSSTSTGGTTSGFSPNISVPPCSSHKENLFVHDKTSLASLSSSADKCYSCGQSSLFQSELQSVVFNSLIASLET